MMRLLILFGILGILPLPAGSFWCALKAGGTKRGESGGNEGSLAKAYLYGLLTLLALFQLLAVPMSLRKTSLTLLCVCFFAGAAVLGAAGIILSLRSGLWKRQLAWAAGLGRRITLVSAAALVCIGMQMTYVTLRQHIDEDDAFYLATATSAVQTDGLYTAKAYTGLRLRADAETRYVFASWPLFIAMLSKTSGMHATVLAHMILPAVVLFWVYLVCFLIGELLFGRGGSAGTARFFKDAGSDRVGLFVLLIAALHTFSGYSIYNAQVFALIRGWQGKAVLSGFGLPALVYMCLQAMKRPSWGTDWTLLMVTSAALSCLTTIGTIFTCIVAGGFGLYNAWRCRSVRYLVQTVIACLPAVAYAGAYALWGRFF